jgi:hypothetical protein
MRKLAILGLALAFFFGLVAVAGAATFTIYDGTVNANAEFNWEAACPGFQLQDFSSTTLNPGVSLTTVYGAINTGDDRFDDVVGPVGGPGEGITTWSFDPQVHGVGALFNLAGPGGPGTGIDVYADGNFVGLISNVFAGQFWGFLSTDTFTNITFQADAQYPPPAYETYAMDDLHYCQIPVPPAVWLFGSGLLGLAGLGRRKFFKA